MPTAATSIIAAKMSAAADRLLAARVEPAMHEDDVADADQPATIAATVTAAAARRAASGSSASRAASLRARLRA